MQLTHVDGLPCRKAKCQYKNPREYMDCFMRMDVKYAHVSFAPYEFLNVYSAKGSFDRVIRLFNYPVASSIVNNELYLVRTDMED